MAPIPKVKATAPLIELPSWVFPNSGKVRQETPEFTLEMCTKDGSGKGERINEKDLKSTFDVKSPWRRGLTHEPLFVDYTLRFNEPKTIVGVSYVRQNDLGHTYKNSNHFHIGVHTDFDGDEKDDYAFFSFVTSENGTKTLMRHMVIHPSRHSGTRWTMSPDSKGENPLGINIDLEQRSDDSSRILGNNVKLGTFLDGIGIRYAPGPGVRIDTDFASMAEANAKKAVETSKK